MRTSRGRCHPGPEGRAQRVKLVNGLVKLPCELSVPDDVPPEQFKAKVTVRVAFGDGEVEAMEARGELGASPRFILPPLAMIAGAVAADAPRYREFTGEATIDVDISKSPMKLTTYRDAFNPWTNIVEVRSEMLGKMRPDDKTTLDFELYRSASPSGPFARVQGNNENYLWVKSPDPVVAFDPKLKAAPKARRIAKDKLVLFDQTIGSNETAREIGRGPVYYRVGLTVIGEDRFPVGDEVKSDPSDPGRYVLRVSADDKDIIIPDNSWNAFSQWLPFSVSFSLENQQFDAQGVEVLVRSAGWTGHFWTDRLEGASRFGLSSISGPQGSWAAVRVPYHPGGGDVQITAKWNNIELSRTVHMRADADRQKYAEESAGVSRNSGPARAKEFQDQAAGKRKYAADERAKPADKRDEYSIALIESEASSLAQYSAPYELAMSEAGAPEALTDFKASLAGYLKMLQLEDVRRKLEEDSLNAREAGIRQVLAKPTTDADRKKSLNQELEWIARSRKERSSSPYGPNLDHAAQIATLAGDTEQCKRLRNLQFQIAQAAGKKGEVLGQPLAILSDNLPMLTGNRQEAAELLGKVREMQLTEMDAAKREGMRKWQETYKPPWYPSTRPSSP